AGTNYLSARDAYREAAQFAKKVKEVPEGMVLIPAGEFMMGSPSGEGSDDEHPQHTVYVDAFYMDKYEVTNAQYKKFCDTTSYVTEAEKKGSSWARTGSKWKEMQGANWRHPIGPDSDIDAVLDHPVVHINWEDATAYAEWAGKRLPTEAEWEKTCRSGTSTKYSFGNSESQLGDYAWYDSNSGNKTHPVGQKKPNSWGLYDMHGNVWEWCSDWYDLGYYAVSPSRNPSGPTNGQYRVVRGGSWDYYADCLRSARRFILTPSNSYDSIGFRCAQDS
ncbi:MAG: formylglycine-generating enzyme family protein, partial [Dehalococcoidia bacterium]|nr:formylglycine-generating enzyme family protein [Dehalococcoidia bacterium]